MKNSRENVFFRQNGYAAFIWCGGFGEAAYGTAAEDRCRATEWKFIENEKFRFALLDRKRGLV